MKFWVFPAALVIVFASCSNSTSTTPPGTPVLTPAPPPVVLTPAPPAVTPPGPSVNQQSFKWSDPQAWGGTVPIAGATVTIPAGKYITLDVSPPALKGLQIDGTLVFENKDLDLTANWIMVHGQGRLEVGRIDKPFAKRATITLTGTDTSENIMNMGTKVLGVMGGVIELVGETDRVSWTRLTATASKDARVVTVENAQGWRVGDRIVIASTDFDPLQAEDVVITEISGNTLKLDKALAFMHFGQVTNGIDERAEVGLLTRNVTVRGDASSSVGGFGAHMMVMADSTARISGVQFQRVGQKSKLKRYPLHWHFADGANASFIRDSSIWESFNRCITIHATNNVLVQNNVAYNTLGHCYFLEDGAETGNRFEHNLAVETQNLTQAEAVIPSDTQAASYWISNPNNTYIGNVAAGSQNTGFWFALPEHPTGISDTPANRANVWPRRTRLGEFRDNVSHSNDSKGFNLDDGTKPDGTLESTFYKPYSDPIAKTGVLTAEFKNFTTYKNRFRGVWFRGSNQFLIGAKIADSAIGATFASDNTVIQDSLIVAETSNKGTPAEYEVAQGKVGLDGRSLPRPWDAAFPVRGFEFYDGQVSAASIKFVNFKPNVQRPASALSYLLFTSFDLSVKNFAQKLTFENSNAVYFPARAEPTNTEIMDNEDNAADGYRAAVFHDADGTVTGTANANVVVNNPFLIDANCVLKTEWNAQICNTTNRYGRVWLENTSTNKTSIAPVTLTREEGARPAYSMWGVPNEGAASTFQTSVLLGRSYSYALSGTKPNALRVHLRDIQAGDFVVLSMPWSGAVFAYQNYWIDDRNTLPVVSSLIALMASTKNTIFIDGQTLRFKLIAPVGSTVDWTTAELCGTKLCQ